MMSIRISFMMISSFFKLIKPSDIVILVRDYNVQLGKLTILKLDLRGLIALRYQHMDNGDRLLYSSPHINTSLQTPTLNIKRYTA